MAPETAAQAQVVGMSLEQLFQRGRKRAAARRVGVEVQREIGPTPQRSDQSARAVWLEEPGLRGLAVCWPG